MKKILISIALFSLFSAIAFAAPVNINQADAQLISSSLNGIGAKKAQAIVDYREKNGDFANVDDLTNVKGIGDKLLSKVRDDVLLSSE